MDESSGTTKKGSKRGVPGGVGSGDTSWMHDFVDRVETISWEELMLDQKQTKDQVRAISDRHANELVTHLLTNESVELELTVYLHKGAPSSLCFSSWLSVHGPALTPK